MKTYFAYRLPHSATEHFVKGDLIKRESIATVMGRGIVICDFRSENIYQLENIEPTTPDEWNYHYSKRENQHTTFDEYRKAFDQLQIEIKTGRFDKIVLTKVKELTHEKDPLHIFSKIEQHYHNTFNYILSSPELGTWIGATPEMLCEIEDEKVTAISLAGTKTATEKWTNKEIEEQLYVTSFIEKTLKDLHCTQIDIDGPHNINAGPVVHLYTKITANLLSRESWRKVIDDLHPTPATCGIPALKSKAFIKDVENHDRSIYTGFIGVFNEDSKKCFVNLRCMEMFEESATLYVGGGITAASNVDKEWEETERKSKTLERFLTD